jgi:protein ImuB
MARARRFPVPARGPAPVPPAGAGNRQAVLPLDAPPRPVTASSTRQLWFCVYLPRLALEALNTAREAAAVVEERQGVHRVLLANPAAATAGVLPGQSSNAALALLPELVLEERSRQREQQVLEQLAGWLEQFSSLVSHAAADVLLFEVAGSLRLFGGLKNLRQQVSGGLRRLGFTAALAIAPTPLAATWLARSGRRICVRDPANLAAALRQVPLGCLDWPAATLEALSGIGVVHVGDCLRLPRDGFARRFGAGRLLELDRALGRLPDPRPGWRAPEGFVADHELLEEQSDRELLLAVCRELLERLEHFLLVRQLGTQRLDFGFYHLRADATALSLGSAQADRSAVRWLDLLRLRFERVVFAEPVIAVRLQSGAVHPLQTGTGRLAFESRRQLVPGHSIQHLAERLGARVGRQAVHGVTTVAEHRPQHAWTTRGLFAGTAEARSAGTGASRRRPLWMLPEPALLQAEQGHPVHLGRLRLLDGPERLETGWWDDDSIARDYYLAVNPRGMRLWVFRDRNPRADWYLHGFFG